MHLRLLMKTRTWTDNDLKESVKKCKSFAEVAYDLNLCRSSNSALKKRAEELNLDFVKLNLAQIEEIGDLTFWVPKSQIVEGLGELQSQLS